MAPNPRVKRAYDAMKALGIEEKRVKPVLKNLVKLYDKKWDLIEEDHYRVLADAIFEGDDISMPETKKKKSNIVNDNKEEEEEEEEEDTSVPPLKRLRRGHDVNQSPDVSESLGLRAEDRQVSPQSSMKQKGKEPMCSEPEAPNLSSSRGVRFKEPMAESRHVLCPQETVPKMHPLIKPKDEPFSGGMFINEVPVAVIYPDHSSNKDVLMVENGENRDRNDKMTEEDTPKEPSLKLDVASSPSGEVKLSLSRYMAVGEPKFHMPTLEAVIKLTEEKYLRSHTITDPNFSVMELLENVCESFLELGSDSVKKSQDKDSSSNSQTHDALKTPESSELEGSRENLCVRFETSNEQIGAKFDVGEKSSNGTMRNSPTRDVLEKPTSMAVLGGSKENISARVDTTDEQVPSESDLNGNNLTEVDKSQGSLDETTMNSETLDALEKPTPLDAPDGSKENPFAPSETSNEQVGLGLDASNEKSLAEVGAENLLNVRADESKEEEPSKDLRPVHDVNDITKGEEKVEVPWINALNRKTPPCFLYIPRSLAFHNAGTEISLSKSGDLNSCLSCFGDCLSATLPCACARATGGQFAYTPAGSVKETFLEDCISLTRDPRKQFRTFCEECPLEKAKGDDFVELCKGHSKRKFIKECWSKCGCSKRCGNRVVQRGITRNLQVFFASDEKGWGLRTLEDLPKGAFICEYVGEILTTTELFEKHPKSAKNKNGSFLVLLDAEWGSKATPKPKKALSLDASQYGNVARFINHRCLDSNLVEIPVDMETSARHYYHLAFFTTRNVAAMEELTWDYGIDFDDDDHPIKTFPCHCGSKFCRNIKRQIGSQPALNSS